MVRGIEGNCCICGSTEDLLPIIKSYILNEVETKCIKCISKELFGGVRLQ